MKALGLLGSRYPRSVLAAFADSTIGESRETTLAVAGVITALLGLIIQAKLSKRAEDES